MFLKPLSHKKAEDNVFLWISQLFLKSEKCESDFRRETTNEIKKVKRKKNMHIWFIIDQTKLLMVPL